MLLRTGRKPMLLSPEELLAKADAERKLVAKGVDKRLVAKVLRLLAPVYGYSKHQVNEVWDSCTDNDLLQAAKQHADIGNVLPTGLVIGGHTGLRYPDLLSLKFRDKPWWRKFRHHMDLHGEVVWVLPIAGSGYWVIHNTAVDPNRQQPAIMIPARKAGLNHVRVQRLELFTEEHHEHENSKD